MPASSAIVSVVGSLNVDLIATVDRLPKPGETISAGRFVVCHGGKGANQAVAALRQGATVRLIGGVGDDDYGRAYRKELAARGVDVTGVTFRPQSPTGTAMITVDACGENQIVLVAGANARLTAGLVRQRAALIRTSAVLLMQLETTLPAVVEAARIAHRAGVRVVLNPSPWRDDLPWSDLAVSTLVVNESEAARLFRIQPAKLALRIPAIRRRLADLGLAEVIITRGGDSTLCLTSEYAFEAPVLAVRPVDTVGAGDSFAGTLAVRLAEGESLERAVQAANCSGALATLGRGAQAALPSRAATDRALAGLPATRRL